MLDFHERDRDQWQPGRLTGLYVLDEAAALGAGHQPCGECRHTISSGSGRSGPKRSRRTAPRRTSTIGSTPPASSLLDSTGRTRPALDELPDGTFVEHDGAFWLVLGDRMLEWSFEGYRTARPRTALPATVRVRTPEPTVAVLRAGFIPVVHPSATSRGRF